MMMTKYEGLFAQCLELPVDVREELFDLLAESFVAELPASELELLRDRVREVEEGRMPCLPADEVLRQLESELDN